MTRLHAIDGIPWQDVEPLRGLSLAELAELQRRHIQQAPRRTDIRHFQPYFLSALLDCLQPEKRLPHVQRLSPCHHLPCHVCSRVWFISTASPLVAFAATTASFLMVQYIHMSNSGILQIALASVALLPMFSNLMVMGMLSPPRRTFCLPSFGIAQTGK